MTNGVRLSVLPTRNGVHHITLCSLLKKPVSMHTAITAERTVKHTTPAALPSELTSL